MYTTSVTYRPTYNDSVSSRRVMDVYSQNLCLPLNVITSCGETCIDTNPLSPPPPLTVGNNTTTTTCDNSTISDGESSVVNGVISPPCTEKKKDTTTLPMKKRVSRSEIVDYALECFEKYPLPTEGDEICDVYLIGMKKYIHISKFVAGKETRRNRYPRGCPAYCIYIGDKPFPSQTQAIENLTSSQMKLLVKDFVEGGTEMPAGEDLEKVKIIWGDQQSEPTSKYVRSKKNLEIFKFKKFKFL